MYQLAYKIPENVTGFSQASERWLQNTPRADQKSGDWPQRAAAVSCSEPRSLARRDSWVPERVWDYPTSHSRSVTRPDKQRSTRTVKERPYSCLAAPRKGFPRLAVAARMYLSRKEHLSLQKMFIQIYLSWPGWGRSGHLAFHSVLTLALPMLPGLRLFRGLGAEIVYSYGKVWRKIHHRHCQKERFMALFFS